MNYIINVCVEFFSLVHGDWRISHIICDVKTLVLSFTVTGKESRKIHGVFSVLLQKYQASQAQIR
jgi:hypothetical protein